MGYLDEAWETLKKRPLGYLHDIPSPFAVAKDVSNWLSTPSAPRQGYDENTAPPDLREGYKALAPDPNADYGRVLPYAADKATGDLRWAMPSSIREGLLGGLDLMAGVKSGEVTPRALNTMLLTGTGAGSLLAKEGSVGAMGARPRRSLLRVPETTKADLEVAPAGIGHNKPPIELPPYLNPDGTAIQGAAYSKASKEALDQVAAQGPGAGPLDLSGNQRIPGIVQEQIPRYDPTLGRGRGVPAHMVEALQNPAVIAAVDAAIDKGRSKGADKWYHNKALYDAFVNELGPEEGHARFQEYMDYQSAASPGSSVPTNIRNASYYFVNPEGHEQFEGTKNYYPYGHKAQNLHRENADRVLANEGEWGGYTDLKKNPKPPSYGTNLGGNLMPVAGDTHAMRLVVMNTKDPRFLATTFDEMSPTNPFAEGASTDTKARRLGGKLVMDPDDPTKPMMKDGKFKIRYNPQQLYADKKLTMEEALATPTMWRSKPTDNEYKALEEFYAERGRLKGLKPAEAQSAAWAGGGEQTGLGTPPDVTFGQMHNERVLYTAMMRKEDPKETLRKLIRKEAPLLSLPGGGAAPSLLASPQQPQQMTPEELRRGRSLLDAERVY